MSSLADAAPGVKQNAMIEGMQLALIIMGLVALVELLVYGPLWRWRRALMLGLMAAIIAANAYLLLARLDAATWLITYFSFYRLINLWRVNRNRIQPDYLYFSSRQASLCLIASQAVTACLLALGAAFDLGWHAWFYLLAILQLLVAALLLLTTLRNVISSRALPGPALLKKDLPALTVAIPARNETDELETCLRSLLAIDYPKLEIIVLDDCSQDKRTPAIVRQFAQAGVVFIAGEEPPAHWLAKNFAYKQLAAKANGEYILFCGTDARFETDSLTKLMGIAVPAGLQMLCLMPLNRLEGHSAVWPLLMQPSRYAWELVLPRQLLRRPPVLSTCWLISAAALRQYGGFDNVSHKVIPESYFARQAASQHSYAFIRSNQEFGVSSQKTHAEQRDTAVRTRYPQLHKRLELVALFSLTEVFVRVLPLILFVIALLERRPEWAIMTGVGSLIVIGLHSLFIWLTYRKFLWNSLWISPVAAIYDMAVLNYSMWRYEFGEVYWKGRNVCLPVMHAYPNLTADLARKS